jgi:hypothetical protein
MGGECPGIMEGTRRDRWRKVPWVTTVGALAMLTVAGACSATPGGNQVGFCTMLASLGDLDEEIASGPDGLAGAAGQLGRLSEVAPPEVAPAVEVLAAGVADMAAAAGAVRSEGTPAALDAAVRAVEDQVGELESASATLTGFARERCGLTLTGATFPETTSTPGSPGAP